MAHIPHTLAPLVLLAGMAASLPAATVHVAQNASGNLHDGASWATALPTVEAALAAAKPGDEVWVAAGVYPTRSAMPPGVRLYGGFVGTETFRDQRPGLPRLTVLQSSGSTPILTVSKATTDTVIDGFTFRGLMASSQGLLYVMQSSPTISHNVFTAAGILTTRALTAGLLSCTGGAPIITDNTFTGGALGALVSNGAGGVIANNTIVGNTGAGLECRDPRSLVVANNIIAFNTMGLAAKGLADMTLRNNCVFGNLGGNYALGGADPTGTNGNISADPRLASYAYGNFHIQPDSPCVDAGDDTHAASDLDIDLLPRVMGAHVDIGADESDGRTWVVKPRIVRVSPAGNDANDGSSWASAKASVQAALDTAAITGGEVWVAEGTYSGTAKLWGGSILLPAYVYLYGGFSGVETERDQRDWAANPTILTLTGAAGVPQYAITAASGYRINAVDGFVISGDAYRPGTGGIACVTASPLIMNNVFTGFAPISAGVATLYASSASPEIFNNAFAGNIIGAAGMLAFQNGIPSVQNNLLVGNSGSATGGEGLIKCTVCPAAVIQNNLFQGNATRADSPFIIGIQSVMTIANNTFVNNQGGGLLSALMPGATLANNIVAFNHISRVFPLPAGAAARNNCIYQSSPLTAPAGNGNIAAYPRFVDLLHGDYRLLSSSPCVDAGDDSLVQPGDVDLDGGPRIRGAHVDVGAYEFGGSGIPGLDPVEALKITGGLEAISPAGLDWLAASGETHGLSITDAVALLKALSNSADR